MKKLLLFSSALAIVMLASCNKEQKEEPVNQGTPSKELSEPQDGSYFSFPATREVATKSYLDGQDFKWEDGEAIAVVSANGNITKFTYNETADAFTSDSFDSSASGPFYVVSPFSESISIVDGKVITVFPADQRPGVHGVDPSALLSVGKTADVETLSNGVELKNAFSLVQVQISDKDVTSISFEGNYQGTEVSPSLAGPVTVDPANGTATVTGRVTSVTLAPESGNLTAGTYTLAVLPQNLPAGMKVVFKRDGEVQAHYRSSSTARSLERNAGISLSSSAINVSGLKARCYYILNETDLQAWNSQTPAESDKAFLGADIDMSEQNWSPRKNFVGLFDGQNHRVYNIEARGNDYVGFISSSCNSAGTLGVATIENLVIGTKDGINWDGTSRFSHYGDNTSWCYVGVLGKAQGKTYMNNVVNYASIEIESTATGKNRIGGICGNWASEFDIEDCINYGSVSNNAETASDACAVGGVVGQLDEPYKDFGGAGLVNCKNYGSITANGNYVRFLAGILANTSYVSKIQNCYNSGAISYVADNAATNNNGFVGGIVANCNSEAKITACKNEGDITISNEGIQYIAGIIAYTKKAVLVSECENNGDIILSKNNTSATAAAAGILGYGEAEGLKLYKCNNYKDFTWKTFTKVFYGGGVFGEIDYGIAEECNNYGKITVPSGGKYGAYASFGGIGAIVYRPTVQIKKCENYGELNIYFKHTVRLGGILGTLNRNGDIIDCKNHAPVSLEVSTANHSGLWHAVGGICGIHEGDQSRTGNISGCLNEGTVTYKGSCAPKADAEQHNYGESIGGILGCTVIHMSLNNNVNRGAVIANNSSSVPFEAGGILGRAKVSADISTSGNTNYAPVSSANSTGAGSIAGGVVGNAIVNSFISTGDKNLGDIVSDDNTLVGSIAGMNSAMLIDSKVGGSVNGTIISSSNFNSYIQGSGSTGSVTNPSFVASE